MNVARHLHGVHNPILAQKGIEGSADRERARGPEQVAPGLLIPVEAWHAEEDRLEDAHGFEWFRTEIDLL